jgi:dihydroorotase
MNILIPSAHIIDPRIPENSQPKSILIENGMISRIEDSIELPESSSLIKTPANLHISIGWLDMHANFCDPGFEHKEDLSTGINAAASGGFTGVALMPGTLPPVQSKSEIEYLINKTRNALVDIFPIGALSQNREGRELTEMYDMSQSGAKAFSDDKKSVMDSGVLLRALLYVKNFNGLVISYADDKNISGKGSMHEGIQNTLLGLKGIPALAEELMIIRDIYLTEYSGSKIHFSTISTAGSVDLIRKAKARGVSVTAEICAHQLAFDDKSLEGFDSHYKVKPPFRSENDIVALKAGLADGTIDAICSDHTPENSEMKIREFEHAAFGIIGLETAYAIANTHLKGILSTLELIQKIAIRPREILNISIPEIKVGAAANLTLFDPEMRWIYAASHIKSKSKNTPFIGMSFVGKPIAIINKGDFSFC